MSEPNVSLTNTAENKLISEIYEIYFYNKGLVIWSEELLENMKFFIAPVLEHRDAFDHLMNYYRGIVKKSMSEEKLNGELESALHHEYRAFFDVADYICIGIRTLMNGYLKKLSKRKVQKNWDKYVEVNKEIYNTSTAIANMRKERRMNQKSFNEYKEKLEIVKTLYDDFIKKDLAILNG